MIDFPALGLTAPDGSIVGVIEEEDAVLSNLAEGSGAVLIGPGDAVPATPGSYILNQTFSSLTATSKARAVSQLVELRRAGATFVVTTHDELLLEDCADEVWWLRGRQLIARGAPQEVLEAYRRHVAVLLRTAGTGHTAAVSPALRDGDGRAELEGIELLDAQGAPSIVWQSGEEAVIRVTVRFRAEIAEPVVGILIRTRIGLNVYGTNTELEKIQLGPATAGDAVRVTYRFRCDLCPGDYTVTAASHDPDGVWHDWLEDAVAFAVTDSRYTAGVANLRAVADAERVA